MADNGYRIPLNDFIEFGDYLAAWDETTTSFNVRMIHDRYDVRKVRAQVRRFRDIMANPPIPQSATALAPKKTIEEKKLTPKQETDKQLKLLKDIHSKLEGLVVPVEPSLATLYQPVALNGVKKAANAEKKEQPKKSKGKKKAEAKANNNATPEETPLDATLPKCIESIVVSGFNPPPGPRKLAGDLTYLEVTLTDGSVLQITAHVAGFYINKSSKTSFDPRPAASHHHLLLDVLSAASPVFAAQYAKLLLTAAAWATAGASSVEAMVQASAGAQSLVWTTPVNESAHAFDANRAQDDLSVGIDERGVIRDWNEEYQCARELPNATLREQIVRSRVLFKIMAEFAEAATAGAIAIVDGTIPSINPMDDESAFVYVYNHIFFSRAVEGQKHVATDADNNHENAYSSANHDLQGVKAYNAADVTGLHTLATVVVDYLGVRIIGQSIIPGILQGEAASKLVYGSVDGGKTIASNPEMHAMMQTAAETLLIAERTVAPSGGSDDAPSGEAGSAPVALCGPVEAKGILGSDNRHYILDLVRITPKDYTFYNPESDTVNEASRASLLADADAGKYTALLRPELVQLYARWKANQAKQAAKKTEDETTSDEAKTDEAKADEAKNDEEEAATLRFNTNVLMPYASSTDATIAADDEAVAKDAAAYLQTMVIPAFVADLRRGAMYPVDGTALTDMLHACGINLRYLGKIASLCASFEPHVSKYVAEILEVEMIARSLKHIVSQLFLSHPSLRTTPGSVLLQVLNALLGAPRPTTAATVDDLTANVAALSLAPDAIPDLDASSLWARITSDVQTRFGYTLRFWPASAPKKAKKGKKETTTAPEPVRAHKTPLLRRVCQRLGWQVASRQYNFDAEYPFAADDVTGVVPVVKTSAPAHAFVQAATLIERGRYLLSQGVLAPAYEMLQDASSLLYQVCGGSHEDAALVCASTATALYHAGDVPGAIASQRRALGLYSQLKGLDYYDTAFAHANLALYMHANAETAQAVAHMTRAIQVLEVAAGPHYPETSVLYYKLGMMCQDVGHVALALTCHREALRRGELDRLQAAGTLHAMAMACVLVGGFREALAYEQKVLSLYTEVFGEEDPRVVECRKYIETFTERAVAGAKGRQELDAAAAADAMAEALAEEWAVEIRREEKKAGKTTSKANKKK